MKIFLAFTFGVLFLTSCQENDNAISIGCEIHLDVENPDYLAELTTTGFNGRYHDLTRPVIPKTIEIKGKVYRITSAYISRRGLCYVVSMQLECSPDGGIRSDNNGLTTVPEGDFIMKLSKLFKVSNDKIKVKFDERQRGQSVNREF